MTISGSSARMYRARFPSRSGDLHWVGSDFATFLLEHLHGSDYAWLADLARLEWAREQASIARVDAFSRREVLGRFAPEQLEHLVFTLQPSLVADCLRLPHFHRLGRESDR